MQIKRKIRFYFSPKIVKRYERYRTSFWQDFDDESGASDPVIFVLDAIHANKFFVSAISRIGPLIAYFPE